MSNFEITDDMLYSAAKNAENIILDKLPDGKELNHVFSKSFEKKMNKLIKQEKRNPTLNKFYLHSKRVVVILLVITIGFLTITFSIEALRTRFINMITEKYKEYTSFMYEGEVQSTDIKFNAIEPQYIPKDFKEYERNEYQDGISIKYKNYKNLEIQYESFLIAASTFMLDTEDAIVKEVFINGFKAQHIIKGNIQQIIWNDNDNVYWLLMDSPNVVTKEDEQLFVKIVKNIK